MNNKNYIYTRKTSAVHQETMYKNTFTVAWLITKNLETTQLSIRECMNNL